MCKTICFLCALLCMVSVSSGAQDCLDKQIEIDKMEKKSAIDCKSVKKCNTRVMNFTEEGKEYVCKELMEKEHKVYTFFELPGQNNGASSVAPVMASTREDVSNVISSGGVASGPGSKERPPKVPKYIILGTLVSPEGLLNQLDSYGDLKSHIMQDSEKFLENIEGRNKSTRTKDFLDEYLNAEQINLVNKARSKLLLPKKTNVKIDFFKFPGSKYLDYMRSNISSRPQKKRKLNKLVNSDNPNESFSSNLLSTTQLPTNQSNLKISLTNNAGGIKIDSDEIKVTDSYQHHKSNLKPVLNDSLKSREKVRNFFLNEPVNIDWDDQAITEKIKENHENEESNAKLSLDNDDVLKILWPQLKVL